MTDQTAEVWKFPIEADDYFSIDMPLGSKILHVDEQSGQPQIWALVDPDLERERRFFRLVGTGHQIDLEETQHYVGTFQIYSGSFVGHLFEICESTETSDEA